MRKSDELRSPMSCLSKAQPDELIFVLRSNDPLFAQTIRHWAAMAVGVHEEPKIHEAYHTADAGDKQRVDRAPKAIAGAQPLMPIDRVNEAQHNHALGRGLARDRDPHDPSYDPRN